MMRRVPHATAAPHRCAAIPFIGNSNAKAGFFEVGIVHGWDPFIYLSTEAVEKMARDLGWQPAHVQHGHKAEVADLRAKLARAEAEVTALLEQVAAVKVLKNNGFAQANPPGRPPRKVPA